MVIRVLDHIRSASTYEDGEVIFRLLQPEISAGRTVEVDFSGVLSVPSAFVNAAFVQLLEAFDVEHVKRSLRFLRSTKQINDLIKARFEFVARNRG